MDNNAILRSLRFALRLKDEEVMRLFHLGGWELPLEEVQARMGREGEPGAVYCVDAVSYTHLTLPTICSV